MRRIALLIIVLLAGLTAAAQSPRYIQFKEYRYKADTLRMKLMLEDRLEQERYFFLSPAYWERL